MAQVHKAFWTSSPLPIAGIRSLILVLLLFSPTLVLAQLNPTLWTSFVPLVLRSPYLSAWMNTTNIPLSSRRAPQLWPSFWPTSDPILGWAGFVRVDNVTTYKWLGDAGSPAGLNNTVLTNIQITPTRTIMSITAGPIDLNVTYLSPIEPSDPAMQSLPFSYYYVTATANDGQSHEVQIYTDISAEWLSGNRNLAGNWATQLTDTVLYHKQFLTTPQPFCEIGNQAQDASVYLASLINPNYKMTYQVAPDVDCRGTFGSNGTLNNTVAVGPSKINNPFTVFAVSNDYGTVAGTPTNPAVWAIGLLRDPAIQLTTQNGVTEQRSAYWRTKYSSDADAITAFLQDFPNAVTRAGALDVALEQNATVISSHYADLVALTARQTIGATELTVGGSSGGSFNLSDVKMFVKDIGGSGAPGQRVNPVEIMYSAFPLFLSLNASFGGWLLSPVLEFASSSAWDQQYAPRDIGLSYPNATGNNAPHSQGVEQSGNMIIMALAHGRASGDGSLLSRYYPLLKTWTDYLVKNVSPVPTGQTTADGNSIANSTNLAIKGIIAIKAMAQISAALHQDADANNYSTLATTYAKTWKLLALPSGAPQIISNYGASSSSYALPYNLFADKWLGTGLIDDETYSIETAGLQSLLNSNQNGLLVSDDSSDTGNTAWTVFTAMTVKDNNVRNTMIDQIWNFGSTNHSQTIFPSTFSLSNTGAAMGNVASPGVGGIYAALALALPNVSFAAANPQGSQGASNGAVPRIGHIVVDIIRGMSGTALLLGLLFDFL